MKPYVFLMIPEEDIELFRKIQQTVNKFPDIDFGEDEEGEKIILSCHILARAIGKVFSLKYIDGYFYPSYQHTWLITPYGNLIDVYPIAMLGGPILIEGSSESPARWLYKNRRDILNGKSKKLSFIKAVKKAETIIKELQKE